MSTQYAFRWLRQDDIPAIMPIEQSSFEYPWTEEEFTSTYRRKNVIGIVLEFKGRIIGYIVFKNGMRLIEILNVAIKPEFRQRGLGSFLLQEVVVLSGSRQILVKVSEWNDPAIAWLAKFGLKATKVERCDENAGDVYHFCLKPSKTKAARATSSK